MNQFLNKTNNKNSSNYNLEERTAKFGEEIIKFVKQLQIQK